MYRITFDSGSHQVALDLDTFEGRRGLMILMNTLCVYTNHAPNLDIYTAPDGGLMHASVKADNMEADAKVLAIIFIREPKPKSTT